LPLPRCRYEQERHQSTKADPLYRLGGRIPWNRLAPATVTLPLAVRSCSLAFAGIFAFIMLPSTGLKFRFAANAEGCIEQMPFMFVEADHPV